MNRKPSSHTAAAVAPLRISHMLKLLDTDQPRYFHRFRFITCDGRSRTLDLPREAGESAIIRQLLAHGLKAPPPEVRALVDKALANEPSAAVGATRRPGWHDNTYVGHRRSYGPQAPKLLSTSREPALRYRRGSLDDWKAGLHAPCLKSPELTFSLCLAFASVLSGLIGLERGVLFHLWGEPGGQMSLCARAAQSVLGRAWQADVSARALRPGKVAERCAARSDLLALFDDLRPGTEISEAVITAIADGVDPGSSKRARRPEHHELGWRTWGLSTSELPLGRHLRGAELRYVDVPVPTVSAGGIFNRMVEGDDPSDLATQVETTTVANYGYAFDAFIRHLVDNRAEEKAEALDVQGRFVAAVTEHWRVTDHPLASAFGLVFAAGIIATRAGVTPWGRVKHLERVVVRLYRRALAVSFNPAFEVDRFLALLPVAREAGCLPHVEKSHAVPAEAPTEAIGIRRKLSAHGECVLLRRDYLHTFWPDAGDFGLVTDELKKRGLLVLARSGRIDTIQVQVRGISGRPRYYGLKASGVFPNVPQAA